MTEVMGSINQSDWIWNCSHGNVPPIGQNYTVVTTLWTRIEIRAVDL